MPIPAAAIPTSVLITVVVVVVLIFSMILVLTALPALLVLGDRFLLAHRKKALAAASKAKAAAIGVLAEKGKMKAAASGMSAESGMPAEDENTKNKKEWRK